MAYSIPSVPYPEQEEELRLQKLKRRLAALKGWLTRKNIDLLTGYEPGAHWVTYPGRYGLNTVYYRSPGGDKDAHLVKKYFRTKEKLRS